MPERYTIELSLSIGTVLSRVTLRNGFRIQWRAAICRRGCNARRVCIATRPTTAKRERVRLLGSRRIIQPDGEQLANVM